MKKHYSPALMITWLSMLAFFSLGSSKCWFGSDDETTAAAVVAPTPAAITIYDEAGTTKVTAHDFSTVELGSSSDLTLTLKNEGESSANDVAFSFDTATATASFQFKGGIYPGTGGTCETTLEAAKSCTIVVSYIPHSSAATVYSTAAISDNLNLTYMADTEKTAEIPLTGSVSYCTSASELLSQLGMDTGSASSMVADTQLAAQSFFWTSATKIKSITLSQYIATSTTFSTLDLRIYGDCSGAPCVNQTALGSTYLAAPTISAGSRAWYTYTLASPATIEANTTYWFVFGTNTLNGTLYLDRYLSNGYGGGNFAYSNNSGTSFSSGTGDLAFKINACD
jgi:hypothetical protein